jgi:NADPH-dependent 2,4-dienoyl-CoA reductase/sulfur reductase-like enzyme
MKPKRIESHPVLDVPERKPANFYWNDEKLAGFEGEMISSALFANGVQVFGHHHKDKSPQGMFCANGQCSQCLVIADGLPVKSCMTPLREGVAVASTEGLPGIPGEDVPVVTQDVPTHFTDVLIIGGGPAGLSAAVELGKLGIETLVIDDKDRPGGKLVLQTHKFFGSVEDSYAGTRGYRIARLFEEQLRKYDSVSVWLESTAVGMFSDRIVGVVKGKSYRQIKAKNLLVTTGAREKMLSFPGNTLPGVYGAGAFQTLVNRDLVKCSDRVQSVTTAKLDSDWNIVPATHRTFEVDTVLIAVGLSKVDEFYLKAREWGMDVYAAGDAQEIAEASAAMFTGRIAGLKIAGALGRFDGSGRVTGIETDRGKIEAPVVVDAAGAYSRPLGKTAGVDIPVIPDSHEGAVTEPVQNFFKCMVVDLRPGQGSKNYYFYQNLHGQGYMLGPGIGEVAAREITGTGIDGDDVILREFSPGRRFGGEEALK